MHTASDDNEDFSPDFDWDAAARQDAQGYTAVLRIPFASLRFTREPAGPWRVMVARRVPREQVYLLTSVLVPRGAPSFIAMLQPLQGVTLPERHQFLSLRASLTSLRRRDTVEGIVTRRDDPLATALDLKWRPLPEWVVDATFNPDFSQVALDVPQLAGNTRFALLFPETRPFFFESSDLLRSPTDALYTRSFTAPHWGLRSTWRGARLAGTAFAIDDRGGGVVLLPGAYATEVAEQPGSRALVTRLRGDGQALQWGLVGAQRRYDGDRGMNQVLGPDLAWQIDPSWRLRAQWLRSDTSALAQGGVLVRGPARQGHRGLARLWYQAPETEGDVWVDDLGAEFRDDVGFVAQNGVRSWGGRVARGWHPLGPFNEFWLNLEASVTHDHRGGALVARDLAPGLWLTGAHNLEASLYWHGAAAQRTAADAPLLRERYWKAELVFTPAPWAPLLESELMLGRIADVADNQVGRGGNLNLKLGTRPLAALELEPSLSYGWLDRDGRRRYAEGAHQVLARWHFGPRQTLRAIVQRSSLERDGQPLHAATTGSLTWSWRHSAGTVLYLGASRSRDGVGSVRRGNEVFVKLQVDADTLRQGLQR
jgi:hypothetical protein